MVIFSHAASPPRVRESLDLDWRFHLGDVPEASNADFFDPSWRVLKVPHDFSVEGDFSTTNFSCTGYLPGGIAWYQKRFVAPAAWGEKLVSVEFDGVSEKSQVWLNGELVGGRPWAYTSFACDLTGHLKVGGTNVLAVRVDHSAVDDSRFYVGSGIYRHVWLVATEKAHGSRSGVFVATPVATASLAEAQIQSTLENEGAPAEIEVRTELLDDKGRRAGEASSATALGAGQKTVVVQRVPVSAPKLWSPDRPALYTAVTTLRQGGRTADIVKTTFGIRKIEFDAQRGFLLNGEPTKFKGVCLHHDAGALGAAVPEAALERRLRILKEMGCNAIRTSHNAPAPEMLEMCDRLGFLVMDEAFDEWSGSKKKWVVGRNAGQPSRHGSYSEFFAQWAEADMLDLVLRDRNHPAVVLWSIGNEVDYPNDPFNDQTAGVLAKDGQRLIGAVRRGDTTRPITAGLAALRTSNPIGLADELDVVGYNYQLDQLNGDLAKYPARKFVGSEDGLEMGYVNLIATNARVTGQFLWVGIDFLGEANAWPNHGSTSGLLDTCGFMKPRGWMRESLWAEQPMVFAGVRPGARGGRFGGGRFGEVESHWNWEGDARANLPVEVYSNCREVELFLNGKSLGVKQPAEAADRVLRWEVVFEPGELKAVGRREGKTVEYRLATAGARARMELAPDRTRLRADGEDAANIELRLVDAKGVLEPRGDALCTVQVRGAGRLLALDNGNQNDGMALRSPSRQLNRGRALAVVQSLPQESGAIYVEVMSAGLPEVRLTLQSR
ncbi:MAG TPA: glycoside hydrolase family 2 TIM barrel-domain containing protein [Candidatus Acidoferrum sp.]|nr:glycoside hydrolase family 2 TIM barrel-domain containing protein [Candidatus Acidoferrum sp.]